MLFKHKSYLVVQTVKLKININELYFYIEDIWFFSVQDRISFHRMNAKCNIFMSGGSKEW